MVDIYARLVCNDNLCVFIEHQPCIIKKYPTDSLPAFLFSFFLFLLDSEMDLINVYVQSLQFAF